MTDTETQVAPIVAPETIARQIESVVDMLKDQDIDEQLFGTIKTMLRVAARNTRMLFELKADENGRFMPKTQGEIFFLVDLLMRAEMAPSSYKNNPAAIAIGIQKAIEVGVDPIGGLSNIMVVNNRPSVWGDLAQALIQRSGKLEKQLKEEIGTAPAPGAALPDWPDDYGCRVTSWRVGNSEPFVGEFTVADAKRAKLWLNTSKQPWITDPKAMLFNRARARSQRDGFADCLYNMGIAEEQADFIYGKPAKMIELPAPASPVDDDEPVTQIEHRQEIPTMQDFGSGEPIPSAHAEEPQQGQAEMPLHEEGKTE